jgi:hypothetical protein
VTAVAETDTTELKKGTRVVAVDDLPGVPEGTAGKLGDAVGLTLIRYRVDFDNGERLTSVTHTKLVPEKEWDDFKANREAAAEKAAEAAAAPAEAPADDGGDGGGSDGATDDRLAALLARSKAARERKSTAG